MLYSIKFKKIFFTLVSSLFFLSAHRAFAQPQGGSSGGTTGGSSAGPASGAGANQFTTLQNPLRADIDTVPKFIEILVELFVLIGFPIVVLAFVYTGFLFVKAQGNETKLKEAKDALFYTVIGAFVLLGAWVIARAIGGTVAQLTQ